MPLLTFSRKITVKICNFISNNNQQLICGTTHTAERYVALLKEHCDEK